MTPNECDTASTGGASIEVLCFNSTDDAATEFQLDHNGSGAAQGTIFMGSDPDVAEYYPVNDQSIYSGDIVSAADPAGMDSFDQHRNVVLGKSSQPYQSSVVGVISSGTPFLVGNENPFKVWGLADKIVFENQRATALAGRVPVKVSSINGEIKVGDAVTTSEIPGFGMKSTQPGSIVGKALQGFDGTVGEHAQVIPCPTGTASNITCARIMVHLNISWQDPTVVVDEESGLSNAALTSAFTISQNLITAEMDMKVVGQLTADGGLTVNGPAEFNGPAVFKAMAEFIDRVIFNKDVEFRGRAIFNSDSGGFAQLATGETEVTIAFDQEYAEQPVISASPVIDKLDQATYDAQVLAATCEATDTLEQCQTKVEDSLLGNMPTYVVTKKSTTGFTIKLSQPATQEVKFSWSAIAVSQAKTAQN